jgi:hypothetical protein
MFMFEHVPDIMTALEKISSNLSIISVAWYFAGCPYCRVNQVQPRPTSSGGESDGGF